MNAQGERKGIKRGTASEEFRSSSRETPGFKPGELHYHPSLVLPIKKEEER